MTNLSILIHNGMCFQRANATWHDTASFAKRRLFVDESCKKKAAQTCGFHYRLKARIIGH